ncbi:hypothetical protein F4782DRAFT_519239 [Xylaria castorea]|nr:hypothetical protein F4782DRAFT_519239 [Xylaria castorea]
MRVRHTTRALITGFTINSSSSSRISTTAGITGFARNSSRTRAQQQQQQQQQHQPRTAAAAAPTTTFLPSRQRHRLLINAHAMSTSPGASPSPSASASASASASGPEPKQQLPPLSGAEFREYNRLAEHMDMFHAHFRSTWEVLYTSASSGRRAQGLSIRAFINLGLELVSHLETHHAIEERYVFPDLARRMPEFRTGRERDLPPSSEEEEKEEGKKKREAAELLRQHVEIHHGMDGLRAYLRSCLSGETELQMSALKAQLDTWGAVLWTHLDQEVKTLGAENMRRYWSLDEMRKMRM